MAESGLWRCSVIGGLESRPSAGRGIEHPDSAVLVDWLAIESLASAVDKDLVLNDSGRMTMAGRRTIWTGWNGLVV